jgi:hypothetical protein
MLGLNPEQLQHITSINERITAFNRKKYELGALEHKGFLGALPVLVLLQALLEEVVDIINYLYSALDNLERAKTRLTALKELLQETVDDCIANNESLELIEDVYDPIRRIEAVEALLYG